jgi:hypothetical protein
MGRSVSACEMGIALQSSPEIIAAMPNGAARARKGWVRLKRSPIFEDSVDERLA